MFTIAQIEQTHGRVKSGTDFPRYIQEIKQLGVRAFETWVKDSHTVYFGKDGYQKKSKPKYDTLTVSENSDKKKFSKYLKSHQQGNTDYYTFCTHCAETGIEKWMVDLDQMTCTYFDKTGKEMLKEHIPGYNGP